MVFADCNNAEELRVAFKGGVFGEIVFREPLDTLTTSIEISLVVKRESS